MSRFLKLFRSSSAADQTPSQGASQARVPRRSTGFQEFTKAMAAREGLSVLDLGPTSPTNIQYLTSRGHKLYNVDALLSSHDPALLRKAEDGAMSFDTERFFAENFAFHGQQFDAVLLWSLADYLPEVLVKPLIGRLHAAMNPGGMLFAFFHTKDAGPDAAYQRYHIAGGDVLELQPVPGVRLQRVFNNRNIETLFQDFKSLKFFLARDHMREVLVMR